MSVVMFASSVFSQTFAHSVFKMSLHYDRSEMRTKRCSVTVVHLK